MNTTEKNKQIRKINKEIRILEIEKRIIRSEYNYEQSLEFNKRINKDVTFNS